MATSRCWRRRGAGLADRTGRADGEPVGSLAVLAERRTWTPRRGCATALAAGLGRPARRRCVAAAMPPDHPAVASSSGARPDQPLPVRGCPGRRHRAAGPLVPRPHARDGPVHRAARPQDVPSLVAAEPGVQSSGQPLPCRGPGRLVRAVSGPRRFPRHACRVRACLPGRPPWIRGAVPGAERRRAGRPGLAPGGDATSSPRRPSDRRESRRSPGTTAGRSSCCTSRGDTPSTGSSSRRCSSSASGSAAGG